MLMPIFQLIFNEFFYSDSFLCQSTAIYASTPEGKRQSMIRSTKGDLVSQTVLTLYVIS